MTNIEKARELIEAIYPSTSMGDYGMKEMLLLAAMKWKEQEMIEKLKEMEIEDGDIEDFANEEQSSNYGLSEKFISRLKKEMQITDKPSHLN